MTITALAAPQHLLSVYGVAGTTRSPGQSLPTLLRVCRPKAASKCLQGNPGPFCRLLLLPSALHSPSLRGRAGLGPSRCGVKGAWSRSQKQQPRRQRQLLPHQQRQWQSWPRASWPGAPGGREGGGRGGRGEGGVGEEQSAGPRRQDFLVWGLSTAQKGSDSETEPKGAEQRRDPLVPRGKRDLGDRTTEAAPPGGSGG